MLHLGQLREPRFGRDLAELCREPRSKRELIGVVAQAAHRIGALDRVRLAEQVVGQLGIRRGTAELAERRAGPIADLAWLGPEKLAYVVIALAALEQQLQQSEAVGSHGAPPLLATAATAATAASGGRWQGAAGGRHGAAGRRRGARGRRSSGCRRCGSRRGAAGARGRRQLGALRQ